MKTKTLLLSCLLLGIGLTRLSAQNSRDVYDWPVPQQIVTLDIYCGGQLVDQIQNTTDYYLKCRDKYKKEDWTAWNQHLNNVIFVSLRTGELFVLQGHEKGTWSTTVGVGEFTGYMVGDQGNHYIFRETYELDPVTWELTTIERRTVCH